MGGVNAGTGSAGVEQIAVWKKKKPLNPSSFLEKN